MHAMHVTHCVHKVKPAFVAYPALMPGGEQTEPHAAQGIVIHAAQVAGQQGWCGGRQGEVCLCEHLWS